MAEVQIDDRVVDAALIALRVTTVRALSDNPLPRGGDGAETAMTLKQIQREGMRAALRAFLREWL